MNPLALVKSPEIAESFGIFARDSDTRILMNLEILQVPRLLFRRHLRAASIYQRENSNCLGNHVLQVFSQSLAHDRGCRQRATGRRAATGPHDGAFRV